MIATDLNQLREYIVTVKKDVDWRTVHNELIVDTSANDSVDSSIVPDRNCEVAQERANNPRNTHYTLSESEAINLRKDSRILAVQALDLIPEPKPRALQNGNFNRTSSSAGRNSPASSSRISGPSGTNPFVRKRSSFKGSQSCPCASGIN